MIDIAFLVFIVVIAVNAYFRSFLLAFICLFLLLIPLLGFLQFRSEFFPNVDKDYVFYLINQDEKSKHLNLNPDSYNIISRKEAYERAGSIEKKTVLFNKYPLNRCRCKIEINIYITNNIAKEIDVRIITTESFLFNNYISTAPGQAVHGPWFVRVR